jgi:hypothetical protein
MNRRKPRKRRTLYFYLCSLDFLLFQIFCELGVLREVAYCALLTIPPGVLRSTWTGLEFFLGAQCERSSITDLDRRVLVYVAKQPANRSNKTVYEQHLMSHLQF